MEGQGLKIMSIAKIINNLFQLYNILILVRVFLTWIPSIDWGQQPLKTVREITDLYLDLFRKFIPPINGIDFSPIVAIIVLNILQGLVVGTVAMYLG